MAFLRRRFSRQEFFLIQTLLIAACFFLPATFPLLFFWLDLLLAGSVFILLQIAKDEEPGRALGNGLLAAGLGVFLLGEPAVFVFSLTMLPLGWSLHRSANTGLSPAAAGGAGLIVLSLTWLVFWLMYGIVTKTNPYSSLQVSLDNSLVQVGEAYRIGADLPLELVRDLKIMIAWMRRLLPEVLPGLLAGCVLLIVWLNLVIGNGLLRRLWPDKAVWPEYRCWRLPEMLIWLLITATILALLGRGCLAQIGYSLTVVVVLLYFFQGAAIFAHLLHRWHVSVFWRVVLYFFVAVQGYGMLLLTVTGVADTWADFRRLNSL